MLLKLCSSAAAAERPAVIVDALTPWARHKIDLGARAGVQRVRVRTLPPLVMSAWGAGIQWRCCGGRWRRDLRRGKAGVLHGLVRYGASNSTYRVEDTVSGRMAPTPPEPLAVIDLSSDMVEKLRLNVVAETVCGRSRGDLDGHGRKRRRNRAVASLLT